MIPAPRQRLLPLITRGRNTGTAFRLRAQTAEEGSRTPTPLRAEDFESRSQADLADSADSGRRILRELERTREGAKLAILAECNYTLTTVQWPPPASPGRR